MEFGNVYEVFQLEDRVKVIEPRLIYYGQTGTIVQIEDISYNTEPIYTVRLNKTYIPFDDNDTPLEIKVKAKGLEKIPRREAEEETIGIGLRSGKTYLTKRGTDEMKNAHAPGFTQKINLRKSRRLSQKQCLSSIKRNLPKRRTKMMKTDFTVKPERRLCIVNGEYGYFHCLGVSSTSEIIAVIEFEDRVACIYPWEIKFVDEENHELH